MDEAEQCRTTITINGWTYRCQKLIQHSVDYHWWNRSDVVGISGSTAIRRIKWFGIIANDNIWIDDGSLEFAAI